MVEKKVNGVKVNCENEHYEDYKNKWNKSKINFLIIGEKKFLI